MVCFLCLPNYKRQHVCANIYYDNISQLICKYHTAYLYTFEKYINMKIRLFWKPEILMGFSCWSVWHEDLQYNLEKYAKSQYWTDKGASELTMKLKSRPTRPSQCSHSLESQLTTTSYIYTLVCQLTVSERMEEKKVPSSYLDNLLNTDSSTDNNCKTITFYNVIFLQTILTTWWLN